MRKSRLRQQNYLLRIHGVNAVVNLIMVYILCAVIITFAFNYRRERTLNDNDLVAVQLNQYFGDKYNDLWKIYMPVFSDDSANTGGVEPFEAFSEDHSTEIDPFLRAELTKSLRQMAVLDGDIVSISLWRRTVPDMLYFYYKDSGMLQSVSRQQAGPEQQAVFDSIDQATGRRILTRGISNDNYLSGGGLPGRTDGAMMITYSTSSLNRLYTEREHIIEPRILIMTAANEVIYDTDGMLNGVQMTPPENGDGFTIDGRRYVAHRVHDRASAYVSWALTDVVALKRYAMQDVPLIVGACSFCAALSLALHALAGYLSARRVKRINRGIQRISTPDLDFRFVLPADKRPDEFSSIEQAINSMTEDLQCYIGALRTASRQRIQAEMNELQAKFNPHFLYNTLESVRARLLEVGEDEASDMIRKLAYILRNYVGGQQFITVQEEIAFLNVYIDFYRSRYEDSFSVRFDVDSSIVSLGIIRNLLQPIVENYFVHGFDVARTDNLLVISCAVNTDGLLEFNIENNGRAIPPDRLAAVCKGLENSEESETGRFGLYMIQRRIQLFYGEGCRLEIESNNECTRTRVVIRQMTLEEHKKQLEMLLNDDVYGSNGIIV